MFRYITENSSDWKEFLDKLKSMPIEKWERRFDEFIALDFTKIPQYLIKYESLERGLYQNINAVKYTSYPFTVFRLRAEADINFYPRKTQDLSYNPNSASMERANKKGYPVFYCSETAPTTIKEMGLEYNNIAFLGVWDILGVDEKKPLIISPFGKIEAEINGLDAIRTALNEAFENDINHHGEEIAQYLRLPREKFNEAFIEKSKSKYNLTSWLAHKIIYEYREENPTNPIHGIMYPSIANNHVAFNYALHPSFVQKNLRLKEAYKFHYSKKSPTQDACLLLEAGNGCYCDNSKCDCRILWGVPNDESRKKFHDYCMGKNS
jgi:hypothetical protein